MKKIFCFVLLAMSCVCGYAQVIDPALLQEMGQKKDDEKIEVFVIMKQQYDREQLSRRADNCKTRAARREFVVNELKQYAEVSQYDIKQSLAEMEKSDMVTTPRILWIANALYFSAAKQAIYDLAKRQDIEVIGYDNKVEIPDDEVPRQAEATRGIAPNVTQVNADQVWDLGYKGQGVVVAVIDVGVNYNHRDFKDHLWNGGEDCPNHGWDFGYDDDDPMDVTGHGTHCAGTVCGDGGGGQQTGIAPDVTLMCVKTNGNNGSEVSRLCRGMQWALEHGCDVFSMSMGEHPSVAAKTLYRNTFTAVLRAGVIGAIAAGNDGGDLNSQPIPNNICFPGGCPPPYLDPVQQANSGELSSVVCVGAVDCNDVAADFTSVGPVTWANTSFGDYPYVAGNNAQFGLIRPDVCAPGVEIVSADYSTISGYCKKGGTSMATPCVAGCMALMLSKNPELTPEEICRILEETAVPIEEGKSNIYGYGRVDALAAINAVPENKLSLVSYTIHDEQGNNNQQLNAGESVTMDMDLRCSLDTLNNAMLNITTTSDDVTITNGTIPLPNFVAGQTQTVTGFAFTVHEGTPVRRKMTFYADVLVGGSSIGHFAFTLAVKGTILVYESAIIVNDNNGNGILEPGETADLRVFLNNIGNMTAPSVTGTLSVASNYLTINDNEVAMDDIAVFGQTYIDFNVTLSAEATDAFPLPCTLDLTDAENQTDVFSFSMFNITTTANPVGTGIVTGAGTYGTGTMAELTAVATDNYVLNSWKNGNTVASYTNFSIEVSENVDYVAHFDAVNNVVIVGQATAWSGWVPSDSYYRYTLSEQIYKTEELGEAREISSVAFFNAGTTMSRNIMVYLKHTEKSSFQEGNDWEAVSPEDLLFEGDITFTKGEWTTIYFDRAFAYDGIHNVLLVVDDNTGSNSRGLYCRMFHDENRSIFECGDDMNYNPYCPSGNSGQYADGKSQVLFGIASYDYTVTVSADPVDGGTVCVDEGPFYQGQPCTATATPSGDNVFYYWSENGERVSADTTYHFRVMASRQLVAHFGPPVTVTVATDPEEGGTVNGGGAYGIGQPVTLSATTNPGYVFSHWSKDGEAVSYFSTWNLLVPGEAGYVAHYDPLPQGAVAVGEAASTNAVLPSYSYYNYTLSQQIYTAAEIGEAGLIGSIAFFNTGYQKTRNLTIYMVNTTKSAFGSNSDWIVPTEEQQVFSGEVVMAKGRWTTVVLDTAFEYDGVSNLAIIVDDNSGYWSNERVSCRVFETGSSQAIRVYSDGTNYDPLSPTGYSGTTMKVKNQLIITKVPFADCMAPAQLTATEVGPDFVKLSWTEHGSSDQWYVVYNGITVEADTNEDFLLEGLEPETQYTIMVRPACDETLLSNAISITTLDACPVPMDLEANDVITNAATVTWNGYNDSYLVQLGLPAFWISENFDNGISFDWTNDSVYAWTVVDGHFQSGNAGNANTTSSISLTVTFPIDGTIEFDAECKGEGANTYWDHCDFIIDGAIQLSAGANISGWNHYTYDVTAGEHTFTWSYTKDNSVNPVGDYFAVDNIVMKSVEAIWNDSVAVVIAEQVYSGLTPATMYCVRVQGVCDGTMSEWSETLVFTTREAVEFIKEINAYTENGGYYLLAVPFDELNPEAVEHLFDNNYDLYVFDQVEGQEWHNYKGEAFHLEAGKGYLYANSEHVTLNFTGVPYNGDGRVTLHKTGDGETAGWNLVGNPFNEIAYIDREFYVMSADGSKIELAQRDYVLPLEGVFVIANEDGEIITFSTTAPAKSKK